MIYTIFKKKFFGKGKGYLKKDNFHKRWLVLMSASLQCSITSRPGKVLVFLAGNAFCGSVLLSCLLHHL